MTFAMSPLLKARRMDVNLRNASASGGRTATGRMQTVLSDAGFWALEIGQFRIHQAAEAWAYQAMIARLRQGEAMVVTLCLPYRAPLLDGYDVTLTGAVSLRGTVLPIVGVGADLTAGQYFSIANRLHVITDVVDEIAFNDGLVTAVSGDASWSDGDVWVDDPAVSSGIKIQPPLRAAAAEGAVLEFRAPKITVILGEMNGGDLSLDLGRFGGPDISLIEFI